MNIGGLGLALIKEFEGYHRALPDGRCTAYQEKINGRLDIPTIGWGCTRGVKMGDVWTVEQAEAALLHEISSHVARVVRLVTVDLNQNQFDALVSFDYNTGGLTLKGVKPSGVLAAVNSGNFDNVANKLAQWNKFKGAVVSGLVRRRTAEIALFMKPVDPVAPDFMPQEPDEPGLSPGQKTMVASASVGAGGLGTTLVADPAGSLQTAVSIKSSVTTLVAGLPIGRLMIPALIVGAGAAAAVYVWRRAT